ncbi:guanosine-3',5'-bis(diphosphate) 3'-pyrophosphohydrolase MESH1-like [Glandiceps talaboti]
MPNIGRASLVIKHLFYPSNLPPIACVSRHCIISTNQYYRNNSSTVKCRRFTTDRRRYGVYNMADDEGVQLQALVDCMDFAALKHRDQRRKNPLKTPYINHPIGVARILAKEAGIKDLNILQAALLHDTVEDTDTTFDEIEERFGSKVRKIVAEVTDDKSLPKMERKRLQIEHAPHISREAKLVKLADKLYNLRDLTEIAPEGWTPERIQEYFLWGSKVVNGLRGTNQVMEDELDEIFKEKGVLTVQQ